MAEKFEEIAVVVDQSSLGNGIYDLTLKTDKIAKAAKAGQFVSIYSNDKSKLLPRPISLCGINRDDDTIRLVYRVTGEGTGTEEFSKLVRGDKVRILGPLGNGFTVQPGKKDNRLCRQPPQNRPHQHKPHHKRRKALPTAYPNRRNSLRRRHPKRENHSRRIWPY